MQGAILFLEDVAEAPYRVDRMLTSLWLRGELQKLSGIVLGDFRLPTDEPADPGPKSFSMDQVFDNLKMWVKCPIFCGLHAGHIREKLTLPIGATVEMDADQQTLRLLNPQ
jgi:muramoyltetrapeptide carboxypeptidase